MIRQYSSPRDGTMEPRLLRVIPDRVVFLDGENHHTVDLRLVGENFGPAAEVSALGSGTAFETTRVSDTELQTRVDVYGVGPFCVGLIVLNDPQCFRAGTASNILPLTCVREIGKSAPRDESDDSIPF